MSGLHICSCLGHMDQAVMPPSFVVFLDGAQGKESWVGAQPKPCTVRFPYLSWAPSKRQQISPACSAPLLGPSLAPYQPWVKRINHRGSPPRKESPSSSWPHCIRLLLFVPSAVYVWCCTRTTVGSVHLQWQERCPWAANCNVLHTAPCYKLDAFVVVITDINWTPLCWAL